MLQARANSVTTIKTIVTPGPSPSSRSSLFCECGAVAAAAASGVFCWLAVIAGCKFLPVMIASTHVGCNTHLRVKKASLVSWLTVYCKKSAYLSHTRVLKHNLCQGCNPNFHPRLNNGNFGLFWVKKPHSEAEKASQWSFLLILGWGIRICREKLTKIITLFKLPFLGPRSSIFCLFG